MKWVDSATNMLNPILAQQPVGYFDTSDQLVFDSNPGVKTAWDSTMEMISKKESAGLAAFSPEWNAGFKKGKFATVACPAWMMGYIQDRRPDDQRQVGRRRDPGRRRQLGRLVPGRPQADQARAGRVRAGRVPDRRPSRSCACSRRPATCRRSPRSTPTRRSPSFTNPYFSDAPVGTIFSDTAAALQPQYLGTKNGPVRQAVENVVREVEAGSISADDGWQKANEGGRESSGVIGRGTDRAPRARAAGSLLRRRTAPGP